MPVRRPPKPPEPGTHGRIAGTDGPRTRLARRIRWSAACDSGGGGAGCKTVGSAYVGSNPTPATTCENAPLAANSRAGGAFPLCPGVCHLVALWTVMLRCPRTYSGRPSARLGRSVRAATTVGVRSCGGRSAPSAVSRTATDGRASGRFRLDQRRSGRLADASAVTLVGLGCGDDRRAYAVRGRFEGKPIGKSACLLDCAGAVEGLGAATG